MNKIPLTLLAVASLTLTSITAQAGGMYTPEVGHEENGNGKTTQTHFGAPVYVPGAFEACPIVRFTASTSVQKYMDDNAEETRQKLIALTTPVVAELPGYATFGFGQNVAVGKGKPTLNHDGNAYGTGVTSNYTNDTDEQPIQTDRSLAQARAEYARNIKSGKWTAFKNGE